MHYYQKNIGNYARDTGHLTVLEHGVYNLLLDWYYLNERAITMKEAIRVSRGNPEETQVVLSEFFKETEDGWIHSYADRVIEEYHAKAERNRTNGAKGGRPAKPVQAVDSTDVKTQVVTPGMPEETLTNNHKPTTNNQEESKEDTTYLANSTELARKAKSELSEMVDAYHRLLPLCQSIHVLGDKRKRKMMAAEKMARITCKQQGWDWDASWFWDAYFTECSRDDWMAGKVLNKNNPAWKQNIEILIDEKRFSTVMDQTIAAIGEAG